MKTEFKFSSTEMLSFIDEFKDLYSNRPIIDNTGGMKSSHLFSLFFYLKKAKPKLIIESGVYKGQGTWLIKQCCPNSKIISIDINLDQILCRYEDVIYYNKDITEIYIKDIIQYFDPEDILVFFDDHQDFNKRINFLVENKIKHVIYEDNYPYDQGDCISPKKIIEEDDFFVNNQKINFEKNERDYIINKINHYEEFPPLFVDSKTRWNNNWIYKTRENLLNDFEKYKDFYNERFDYTWICYIEIKN